MFFLCKGGWIPKLPCWSCVMDVPIQILLSGEICKKCLWMQNAVDCQSLPGFLPLEQICVPGKISCNGTFFLYLYFCHSEQICLPGKNFADELSSCQESYLWNKFESSRNVSFQRSLANLVALKNSPTKVPNLMFQKIGWFWFSVKHFKLVGSQVSLRVVPYVFSHLAG